MVARIGFSFLNLFGFLVFGELQRKKWFRFGILYKILDLVGRLVQGWESEWSWWGDSLS